ncbi:MAG: hypothetical protein JOZ96_15630 [Acidobacteria bacterium]|nr:hypothetical protein [Acidobacteriota bacterium]
MRFEFYHEGLNEAPLLSVDGTVGGALHLSHWEGNETPEELRADTSTEIALNFAAWPRRGEWARGVEVVTNNHFDADGVLSVWSVLNGVRAPALREKLISAAEAGDFSEFPNEDAVRVSILLQGGDNPFVPGVNSPLVESLAGGEKVDERRAYELVLPEVENVLTRTGEYEALWREGWAWIERTLESFAGGRSRVSEDAEHKLSVVTLAEEFYGPGGFDPARHGAPYTALAHHTRGEVILVATPYAGGWAYRIDYAYYSWAETYARPRVARRNLAGLLGRLNVVERGRGVWKADRSELTSAVKFFGQDNAPAASQLEPDEVAAELREALEGQAAPVTV